MSNADGGATRYAAVCDALLEEFGPEGGPDEGRGFGAGTLKVGGKIFALYSSRGEFVVKLPRPRVDDLVVAGTGTRWDAGRGRPMKEWLAVGLAAGEEEWLALAREAYAFVAAGR